MSGLAAHAPTVRSLYRRFLRELPSRTPSILSNPSPIQRHVRSTFVDQARGADADVTIASAEQYVLYLKAQRLYITLVERYNPGMNMNEEDRVKLTARRVGMDLPDELKPFIKGGSGRGEDQD